MLNEHGKTKIIFYYYAATFNDWELLLIFGKDYAIQAVIIFTRVLTDVGTANTTHIRMEYYE